MKPNFFTKPMLDMSDDERRGTLRQLCDRDNNYIMNPLAPWLSEKLNAQGKPSLEPQSQPEEIVTSTPLNM